VSLEYAPPVSGTYDNGDRTLVIRDLSANVSRGLRAYSDHDLQALFLAPHNAHGQDLGPVSILLGSGLGDVDAYEAIEHAYSDDVRLEFVSGIVIAVGPEQQVIEAVRKVTVALPPLHERPATILELTSNGGSNQPIAQLSAVVGGALVICGSQKNYVTGYDSEVANQASALDPVVEGGVSGFAAALAAGSSQRVAFTSHFLDGDKKTLDTRTRGLGLIHTARFAACVLDAALPVDGRPVNLGRVPLPGVQDRDLVARRTQD